MVRLSRILRSFFLGGAAPPCANPRGGALSAARGWADRGRPLRCRRNPRSRSSADAAGPTQGGVAPLRAQGGAALVSPGRSFAWRCELGLMRRRRFRLLVIDQLQNVARPGVTVRIVPRRITGGSVGLVRIRARRKQLPNDRHLPLLHGND